MRSPSGTTMRVEILIRVFLIIIFFWTDKARPFFREIQKEEFWLYNFPRTEDYYPSLYLWLTLFLTPPLTVAIIYLHTKDKVDAVQALLGAYFSIFLAGSITNVIKMGVGRPRPDFLARCFPDGNIDESMNCNGIPEVIIDGRKSFPSGHSSLSFSCLAYVALYLAGKLHVFSSAGRGSSWRLICFILPLLWATMIAVSRTADYHHHWQDVTVGSILGIVTAYVVYRMYYPPLQRHNSHLPYICITPADTQIPYHDRPFTPTSTSPQFDLSDIKTI